MTSCSDNKASAFLFQEMESGHTNIVFRNDIPENELTNSFVYEYVYNGGGVAIGDVNNDGLDDIYFTSNLEANHLYLNEGNLEFRNVTAESNTSGNKGWTTGVTMVDINNDGLLDIYVCKSGPYEKASFLANELHVNKGLNDDDVPFFEEEAKLYGLADTSNSIQSAFFDFDRDGDLDMYLMNHNPQTFSAQASRDAFSPFGDKFYVNEGGKYSNKTKEVGIYSNAISYGLGLGVSDLNMDGWPDVYISNDYDERDYMYINQQDGTFKDVIKNATNHIANFSMGNDMADFDNDGYIDILTLDMVSEDNYGMKTSMASMNPEKFARNVEDGKHYQYMYNTFHRHSTHVDATGLPFFSDVAQITGMSNTDWSWAPLMADFNNDGRKDVFISNGIKRDFRNKDFFASMQEYRRTNPDALSNPEKINGLIERTPKRPKTNYFYKNEGGLKFSNMSAKWLENPVDGYSNGAAYADLDNDGDLDVVINNVDAEAQLLRNNGDNTQYNFLALKFKGQNKNSFGIGVKVIVYTTNGQQVFENYNVRGYQSSMPPKIHVGLDKATQLDSVLVFWPEGGIQKIAQLELNKTTTISYDAAKQSFAPPMKDVVIFSPSNQLDSLVHLENEFDDYAIQVLLPQKMSQFGPAIAIGDVNLDGRDDIYMGQSTGEISKIYLQQLNGAFKEGQSFKEDAIYEDVDARFFDFDNDGDLDLYVASGGNEYPSNSNNYQDRLYENRKGNFVKRTDILPLGLNISSSRIKVADYNADGFMDVFVGGRHIPHDYPSIAGSYLLKNVKGKFENITERNAPDLINSGMVTDAAWTDFDSDGDLDLLTVGEWMAPTFYKNEDGIFNKEKVASLDSLSGWYFSVKPIDLDNDGDDDYILGNLGENYKYKASLKEPFEVYYNDFDDNGKRDLVLGYYNFGELFPVRGRECSSQQMPSIKKIAPTYDQFGKSTLIDIYGRDNLQSALHLKAYNFKTGILKNQGNGLFEFIPLPELVQLSSTNSIITKDLNGDGLQDLILAGNLFGSEIETPRNDAGYGLVLLQRENFNFEVLSASKSGLFLPADVKNMEVIKIKGEQYLMAGNNNDKVALFRIEEKMPKETL